MDTYATKKSINIIKLPAIYYPDKPARVTLCIVWGLIYTCFFGPFRGLEDASKVIYVMVNKRGSVVIAIKIYL